jgi:hypothetical protein
MKDKKPKTNAIRSIPLDRLIEHPLNANRMSETTFRKLVRNIERTNFYEPIVVRPHPQRRGFHQIINGRHRAKALRELGYKKCDCLIWDIDDEQAQILLATLNRLTGSDILEKKVELLRRLNESFKAGEPASTMSHQGQPRRAHRVSAGGLSKLLPFTKMQIEKLCNLKAPQAPAKIEKSFFAKPLVFFVSEEQSNVIEQALSKVEKSIEGDNHAARRAKALTNIAQQWLCSLCKETEE